MSACVSCSGDLPPGAKFCPHCGSSQAASCSTCGAELLTGAKFCMQCGASQEVGPDPVARRVTSVLFGDLVGFTPLSETRDQEEVREILSAYFEGCRTVIDRYGGTVEKFIGDAVMAVWGVPIAHEDDAERAVRAGLDLVDVASALGDRIRVPGLAMRVGIVTGEVAVTVGARGQGMVAGDPVNTAARVQSVAAPGAVWVDETTRGLAQSAVSFVDAGSHSLKGKEHPLALWQAQAIVSGVGGAQRPQAIEPTHVGRERELRLVKEVFHSTEESRSPSLLLVSAEPGIGKSRLGWEFSKYVDGLSDSVRWMEGRCPAYGDGASFHALAEAFRGRLRVLDDSGESSMGDLLDLFMDTWVPHVAERPWLRARMATLLGLAGASAHPREELFAAWLTVLQRMSVGATATVLLIDDAQYADDGLLDFLEFALTAKDLPLFVLLLTRPELLTERPRLAANPNVVTTHLRELSPAEMSTLIVSLVPGLPDEAASALVERAAGVPLFAMETIRSLADSGALSAREEGGGYRLGGVPLDLEAMAAPVSLQALIASRLDALPRQQRIVVDLASVLGSSFRADVLGRLVGGGPIDEALSALVDRQVLRLDVNPLSGEYGSYSFSQDVVRQVAYSMIARRDRRSAHLRVVDLLEDHAGDADLPAVAHHLAAAVDADSGGEARDELKERALAASEAAGDWAMRVGSWSDADAQFQRAAELTEDPARQAGLLCRVAEVYTFASNLDRGLEAGRRALQLSREADAETTEGRAAGLVAQLLQLSGETGAAQELIAPYWDRFRGRGDADDALRWIARASAAVHADWGRDVTPHAEVLLSVGQRCEDPEILLKGLQVLGNAYRVRGLHDAARVIIAGALQFARARDLRRAELTLLVTLASLEAVVDLSAAAVTDRQTLSQSKELHWHHLSSLAVANLSESLFLLGSWQALDELLTAEGSLIPAMQAAVQPLSVQVALARGREAELLPIAELPDQPDAVVRSRAANLHIRLAAGQTDGLAAEAIEIGRFARAELAVELDEQDYVTSPGEVLARLKDAEAIAAFLDETAPGSSRTPTLPVRSARTRLAAHLRRLRAGLSTEVADEFREAVRLAEAAGHTVPARRAQHDLIPVLEALGETGEAAGLRIQVRQFYESIGASRWLEELDTA